MGGAVLTLSLCLEVCLESTSRGTVTQGLEQGYLKVYINVGSHSLLGTGILAKNGCVARWGESDLSFSGPTPSVLATLSLPGEAVPIKDKDLSRWRTLGLWAVLPTCLHGVPLDPLPPPLLQH